jgi:hypothetical protein
MHVFKSRNVDGVSIGFDVKYKHSVQITTKDLKAGKNILTFVNEGNSKNERSGVFGSVGQTTKNGVPTAVHLAGRTGVIKKDLWNNNFGIFHETLHFTGLSDRYYEHGSRDGESSKPMPGFENDIMGDHKSSNIGYDHYKAYYNWANDPTRRSYKGFLNRGVIDTNSISPSTRQTSEQ